MVDLTKNKIAVYTAVFSKDNNRPFDNLKEFKQEFKQEADFYCFTNLDFKSDFWKIVHVNLDEDNPRKMARKYKVLPHLTMDEYKYHFWLDGSMELLESPKKIIDDYLKDKDIVALLHPDRNCVYKEAYVCSLWKLDDPNVIQEQMEYIVDNSYPENNGLCETGAILRKNTEDIQIFNEYWWFMIDRFSFRDQLSFNYSLWKTNVDYNLFDGVTNIQHDSPPGTVQTKLFKLHSHN